MELEGGEVVLCMGWLEEYQGFLQLCQQLLPSFPKSREGLAYAATARRHGGQESTWKFTDTEGCGPNDFR